MSEGPQYTSCVEAADFAPANAGLVATLVALTVVGGIAALFSGGIGAVIAIVALVNLLRYVLEFMLNGKLICLHRTSAECDCGQGGNMVCAIGEVADTEGIGEDKNPVEDVDNDYSMNVILAPVTMSAFAANNYGTSTKDRDVERDANHAIAKALPQGDLLQRELPPPVTRTKNPLGDDLTGTGYFRTMIGLDTGEYHAWTELIGRDYGWFGLVGADQQKLWADYVTEPKNAIQHPRRFPVPVLHCEFEGNRIRNMLDAIEAFSFGGKWCKKSWITRALCVALQTIFAPLALIAVGVAWATATDGDDQDAVVGGGHVESKEWVVVRGRWVYDGGHTGWSEIHATRIVQKVDRHDVPSDVTRFRDYQKRWCERLSEVPYEPVSPSRPLTAVQQVVADNQNDPAYGWVLHPQIDGCQPRDPHDTPIR